MTGGDIMNSLFIGIDVSLQNNTVYLMKSDGAKHSSFTVQNNLSGGKILSQRIVSAMKENYFDNAVIGLESTSVYGDNLVCFLREDNELFNFNKKIHILNAKQVKKFKDSYADLPKNDYIDSLPCRSSLFAVYCD
jgi:transposase